MLEEPAEPLTSRFATVTPVVGPPVVFSTRTIAARGTHRSLPQATEELPPFALSQSTVLNVTEVGSRMVWVAPAPTRRTGLEIVTCSGKTPGPTQTVWPDEAWLSASWTASSARFSERTTALQWTENPGVATAEAAPAESSAAEALARITITVSQWTACLPIVFVPFAAFPHRGS